MKRLVLLTTLCLTLLSVAMLVMSYPTQAQEPKQLSNTTDKQAPHLDQLTLNGDDSSTSVPTITLELQASDPSPSSGVITVALMQLAYNAPIWVQTDWTGHLTYSPRLMWQLNDEQPGLKYIQATVIDGAGNESGHAYQQFINLFSPTTVYSLTQGTAHSYRYTLCAGGALTVKLQAISGDADLYIWPPDWDNGRQPFKSTLSQGNDELSLTAPVAGNYQVEVYSHSPTSQYKISIQTQSSAAKGGLDSAKLPIVEPWLYPNEAPQNNGYLPVQSSGSLTPTYQPSPIAATESILGFTINNGAAHTKNQTATLVLTPSTETTTVLIQHYNYHPLATEWLLTRESNWFTYTQPLSWHLGTITGTQYFQVWAKDEAGQISASPYQAFIIYAPTYTAPNRFSGQVKQYNSVKYTTHLNAGDPLVITLQPLAGDVDLHVWPPDANTNTRWGGRPAWVSERMGQDSLALIAPVSGAYTVEVYGFSNATYQLSWDTLAPNSTPPSSSLCRPVATVTPPTSLPPVPTAGGDTFEADNSCATAKPIALDGTIQNHTFHAAGDEDWVTFQAITGETYLVDGWVPPTSQADLKLEAWAACSQFLDRQMPTFSSDGKLQLRAKTGGSFAIRIQADNLTDYGPALSYTLSVRPQTDLATFGAAILVAGRSSVNDPLQSQTQAVMTRVYELFMQKGYHPDRIFYLSPDVNATEVDASVGLNNLESAIQQAERMVSLTQTLTLFLMAPGQPDQLILNHHNERLTPALLDSWLTKLENNTSAPVNVIIEADYAGSFIDASDTATQTIRRAGRLIMASTGVTATAYTSTTGAVFADAFITALLKDKSLGIAFEEARWATELVAVAQPQTPWLNADDNSTPNQPSDYDQAMRRSLPYPGGTFCGRATARCISDWPPYIKQAQLNGSTQLQATVFDDREVSRVWAEIYLPSGETVMLSLLNQANGQWQLSYPNFTTMGLYRLVIYAQDDRGLQARPYQLYFTISGAQSYLPLIMK